MNANTTDQDGQVSDNRSEKTIVSGGILYIVPTPIGNLGDISTRAIEILASVSFVAAEDTRHSQRLFQHLGITTKMLSLHEHNEDKRARLLIEKLQQGESIALISDAGTPLISDPGYVLVNACREHNLEVIAIPGPCAAITALSASGLPTDRFMFVGFLPVKQVALTSAIKRMSESEYTTVCYESPRRVLQTLTIMSEVLPTEQMMVIAKELTKTFETYYSGTASNALAWLQADANRQRGEFVLIVGPAPALDQELPPEALSLQALLLPHLPPKKAAAVVAEHYGLKKNALYQAAMRNQEQ